MSQNIVLALSENVSFQPFVHELAQKYKEAFSCYDNQYQIRNAKGGYVVISKMKHQQAVKDEYLEATEYDPTFLNAAASCVYYMFTFNDFEFIKEVLITFLSVDSIKSDECWIDTDYGWVLSGSDLMQHLKLEPTWDWRYKRENM